MLIHQLTKLHPLDVVREAVAKLRNENISPEMLRVGGEAVIHMLLCRLDCCRVNWYISPQLKEGLAVLTPKGKGTYPASCEHGNEAEMHVCPTTV